ncbi:hypothetical protein DM01DRAFT_1338735 [Hesseltinella vesiculosa]|uniref:Uncharacterized protein n=1 Tax=Hesseltinella vesiculosa TaxID=101127 RepID=A0A1X2G961_9FUNG|nr:hypothetical protein DM01DRAFT_1338735 [Hesseltinella vesiculosa]
MSKPALSADIAYSIPVKSQPVLASSSTSSKPTSQLPSSFDSASLAHSWREHCHNVTMIKPLLKDMARLKQSLQFSIKTFIRHLELSSCSSEDLAMLMEAYVFWSKRACGMMPLVSLVNALLPLATANPPTIDLSRSLHLISDSGTLSSYMALLLSSLDVRRSWLNSLLDYDRSILSAFTPA